MSEQISLTPNAHWYLVGIKGVAMTALAQMLLDAGLRVSGCDLAENFVTEGILAQLSLGQLDVGFDQTLPADTAVLVYTAAHQGKFNSMVTQATAKNIPAISQAEALGLFANQKKTIAVCGVGGKSTTSAMITWMMEKANWQPSFSVGVGNIPTLNKTGKFVASSPWFVTEADEYVTDPSAPSRGESITPRFSYLKPFATVCTNLEYDHPDVYKNIQHTQAVFGEFFNQIQPEGLLIVNADSPDLVNVVTTQANTLAAKKIRVVSFGETSEADWQLSNFQASTGKTQMTLTHEGLDYTLTLAIPGKFNLKNAAAAVATVVSLGMPIEIAISAIADFPSTMRRFEYIGTKQGVIYYDDYGHHPHEVAAAIQALSDWYPAARKIVAFQSHTFSRTKQLFTDFVDAFKAADEVVMIDIFPSAREAFDDSVSSDSLCATIQAKYPQISAKNLKTIPELAEYLRAQLRPGDVCITIGAGDIYQVHQLLDDSKLS